MSFLANFLVYINKQNGKNLWSQNERKLIMFRETNTHFWTCLSTFLMRKGLVREGIWVKIQSIRIEMSVSLRANWRNEQKKWTDNNKYTKKEDDGISTPVCLNEESDWNCKTLNMRLKGNINNRNGLFKNVKWVVSSESVHNRKNAGRIGYLNIMNSIELWEKERKMNDVEWQEMICCRMDRWHELADIECWS